MLNKNEKSIDDLMKKVVKQVDLHSPSLDFTNNLLKAIEKQPVIVYKPLISKTVWYVIAACVTLILVFSVDTGSNSELWTKATAYINQKDISFNISLPKLQLSKTMLYSLLFLAFFILVQIPYTKYMFDKN